MTIRTKADFSGTYLTSNSTWPDQSNGEISPADLRAGINDLQESTTLGWHPTYTVNPPSGIKFGNYQNGNYSEFQEDTGYLLARGSGTAWDDLRFPANSINPPGSVNDADRDSSDTPNIGTILFDSASTEIVAGIAQMPHSWVEGSVIRPHIHWSPTDAGAGNVVWQFDYDLANVSGTFNGSYSTLTISGVAGGNANSHQINSFGDIDLSGYNLSTIIKWRISRIGGDTGDTYGSDARLLEFDIHYRTDSYGSRQEFIK